MSAGMTITGSGCKNVSAGTHTKVVVGVLADDER
jgi:hypothetical protein